jgi:hypothetical protein
MNDTENKHPWLSLDDILDRLKNTRLRGLPAQQAEEMKLAAVLVLSTGLDPEDIFCLRWEDAKFEEGVIECRQGLFGVMPRIALDRQTAEYLARRATAGAGSGSIFSHLTWASARSVRKLIQSIHAVDHLLAMKEALLRTILGPSLRWERPAEEAPGLPAAGKPTRLTPKLPPGEGKPQ